MPRLSAIPPGCAFAPRCPRVFARCAERPPLMAIGDRGAACWLYDRAAVAADVRT
jgi:peptide/nickel transport system ATP-binding protein